MAMKLKCLRSQDLQISANPEVVSKSVTNQEMEVLLTGITNTEIEFEEWKRVDVDGKKNEQTRVR